MHADPAISWDPFASELDGAANRGAPSRSCVICSTQRSGSTLLSAGLTATGVLGAPVEYLHPVFRRRMTERWHCGSRLRSYIDALHAIRVRDDGLFSIKVQWDQFVAVRAEAGAGPPDETVIETPPDFLHWLFPGAIFVPILRLDKDRQAVSRFRAEESQVWTILGADDYPLELPAAPYNFTALEYWRRQSILGETCWQKLIAATGAPTVQVVYEELCADYQDTIRRVCAAVQPGLAASIPPRPLTRRMSDTRSAELLERYRAERLERGLAIGSPAGTEALA